MSIEQDIKRHGIEESKYNQDREIAYKYVFERQLENYLLFEEVLMTEFNDIFESVDDLKDIHNRCIWAYHYNNPSSLKLGENLIYNKWLEYVDRETERRIL